MGQPINWIRLEHVIEAVEALGLAQSQLTSVVSDARSCDLGNILLPWSAKQDEAIDLVARLARSCVEVMPEQVLAKRQGRVSRIEREKQKSQKNIDARLAKKKAEAEAGTLPPERRGRPRKKKKAD